MPLVLALFFVLYSYLLTFSNCELLDIPGLPRISYESLGDVNLGGLFPLHQPGPNGEYCGALRELGVLQRAEAMAFYINQINEDRLTLPNVTLGYVILDDCYKVNSQRSPSLFHTTCKLTYKLVHCVSSISESVARNLLLPSFVHLLSLSSQSYLSV